VTVTGTENTSLTWEVSCGSVGGPANDVIYQAPWEPGECTVTATSQADPEKSSMATFTVTPIDPADNLLTN
jgi:chitinase